jgi:hypothetical protein
VITAVGAFTVTDLSTDSIPDPYKTEVTNRGLACLLQRTGSPLQTALFDLHLDWLKVNQKLKGDNAAQNYEFATLLQELITIGSRYGSLAIMGDTNFDNLGGYVAPAGYRAIAPPGTSVSASGKGYTTPITKGIDLILLPVS